jgi:hypothetical protein
MRHRQALLTLCASLAPQVPRRYWTDVYQRLEASVIRASVIRASVIRPNMVNSTACLSHRPDEFLWRVAEGTSAGAGRSASRPESWDAHVDRFIDLVV